MIHTRILLVVGIFLSLSSQGFMSARQHSINPRKLYLNQVLKKIETMTLQDESLSSAQAYVRETIELFDNIIKDFNAGALRTNQEIEYKFINMCNYLGSLEELEPRHLRSLSKQIKKFDDYVKKFCLRRKKYLTQSDIDLFNRITKFNQRMTEGLLKNEYFDIDGYDQCIDLFVHRPLEFVSEHKGLTTLAVVATGAVVGYVYLYPLLKSWQLANRNVQLNVQQLPCLTQSGPTCTVHALYNAMCMRDAAGDINEMQRLMNDRERFDAFFNRCREHLGNFEVNVPQDAQVIVQLLNHRNNENPPLHDIVRGDHSNIIIIPDNFHVRNQEGRNQLDTIGFRTIDSNGENGQLTNARHNFQQGRPQVYIVNTATAVSATGQLLNPENVRAHWVTVGIPVPVENGPAALVTESIGLLGFNRNITNEDYVNQIHAITTQQPQNN